MIGSSPVQATIQSIFPAVASKGKTSSKAQYFSIFWLKSACRQWSVRPRREEREKWREVESEKAILENQLLTRVFAHTAFNVQPCA